MAKTRSTRLPRRIAGMKLSKPLRRRGGRLLDLLSHPLVADLVAAGLIAAGVALRNNKRVRGAAAEARDQASKAAAAVGAAATATADEARRRAAKAMPKAGPATSGRNARRRPTGARPTAH